MDLICIAEAIQLARTITQKNITPSNISYLIQYGRINRFNRDGALFVSKNEIVNYYQSQNTERKKIWQSSLDKDINWTLSFEKYKESETTKHVHRLHPYKGKFIPQLVEYFLDSHTDAFKQEVFFNKGDVILDPFCGSGTTLVEANEKGMHAVGVDISNFNAMISNVKLSLCDFVVLEAEIKEITNKLSFFVYESKIQEFEEKLMNQLSAFNSIYFPTPQFKIDLRNKKINEKQYATEKEKMFLPIYENLLKEFNIKLEQDEGNTFLEKWYLYTVKKEIDFTYSLIENIKNESIKNIVKVILSRTIRSCRATTHSDLATIYSPIMAPYYCTKHGKICKPLFSILKWWNTYSKDTIKRLKEFSFLRTPTYQVCLTGDSRNIDLLESLQKYMNPLYEEVSNHKIAGIFSSPPYVGLIDYHEQHAYAYDLFNLERKDTYEIGALFNGSSKKAQSEYVEGISAVLNNMKQYLKKDYNVFLVANDKFNLYPTIASKANMKIINTYNRPVLNRTEKDKSAYSETIFHMKEK